VRARVRACWFTAGAGKAELTGWSHDVAREREQARGGNSLASGEAGPRGRGRGTHRRGKPVLIVRPHWAERERESAGRGTGARPGWAKLGCFDFFIFPGISICFSISFSLGFSIQIQTKI
jgi:hypothetical protein